MNPQQLQFDQDTLAKFQQAKAAGVPDAVNIKHASQYQASKMKQTAQPQPNTIQFAEKETGPSWGDAANLLPLLGAIGGSFIPGLGTIAGGAVGAGGATFLKQLIQKKPLDTVEAVKEGALAGAGGLLGKGLGFVASKAFPAASEALGNVGERLAVKGLRLNKTQLAGFNEKYGIDAGEYLAGKNFLGKNLAGKPLTETIQPLQKSFDSIAKSSNIPVSLETIQNKFLEKINFLRNTGTSDDIKLAQQLEKELQTVMNKFLQSPKEPTLGDLTAVRKSFDSKVKGWVGNPIEGGKNRLASKALNETIQEVADQSNLVGLNGMGLKDMGIELSKLYHLDDIQQLQSQLGKGNLPIGLTKLLGITAGGVTGGPAGAIAGAGAVDVLNNPGSMGLLSRLSTGLGEAAGKVPTVPEAVIPTLTRTGLAIGAGPMPEGQVPQPGADIPEEGTVLPPMGGEGMGTTPTGAMMGGGGSGQQDQLRQLLGIIMLSKAKSVSDLKTGFDLLQPAAVKPLTAEQQKIKTNAESGLRSLDSLEKMLQKDSLAPLKAKIPILEARTPYATAAREIADVLTRLRTGAALNKEEQKFYESQTPQPLDSQETIQYKLNLFRNLFQQLAYGQQPAGLDAASLSLPQAQ